MCLSQALAKCKTEQQRQATIKTYEKIVAAAKAEDDGDAQAWCRMHGKHGSWVKHPDYPGKSFCASCSTAYDDRTAADAELLAGGR